jgi:8-oxo-dGTP pyrophosphatase MutT (NUDIX family)
MLLRRYTSLLISTSILVQSVSPTLAVSARSVDHIEENFDTLKKFNSTPAPLDFESRAGKTAAGVLHWAKKNGDVYVLLGKRDDSKDIGEWCNFGGGSDAADFKEGEGTAQGLINTAEREVREESNGIYAHHPRLLRKQPFIALYAPEEKGGLLHYMYWQQVQYLEPEIFQGKVAEASESHNKEYTDFMWVKASQLHQAVESQNPLLEVDGKPIAIYRPLFSSLLTETGKTFLSELATHKTIRRFNKEVRPLVNRLYISPSEEKVLPGENISVHWSLPEIQVDSQASSAMPVPFGSNAFGQIDRERQLIGPDGQLISKTSVSFDLKREEDVFAEAVAAHGAAMVELKHKGYEKISPQAEPSDKWNSNCEETLSRIHLRLVLGEEYKTPDAFAIDPMVGTRERLEKQLQRWQETLKQAQSSRGKKGNKTRKIQHAANMVTELQTELKALDKHQKHQLFYSPTDNPRRAADIANIKAYFEKYTVAQYVQKTKEFKREIKLLDDDYEFFADVLEWEEENRQWPTFYHGASANINNLYKSFTYLRELFDLRSFDDLMAMRGTDVYFKSDKNIWDMVNRTGPVENSETSRAMLFLNFVLFAGRETTQTTSSSVEYVLNNHSVVEQNVTERFQEAMALVGFSNPEYAYFQSIFEQYIEHKNLEAGNSVLIAISQNPVDLDDYNYPTLYGRYYKGNAGKEIRSTLDILNGIQGEFERQKKEGAEPFDVHSNDKQSLFPEGRLFLRPERVMDPNSTRVKAFDRFPLTQEERQAHDRDMRQTTIATMADWLAQKTTAMQGSFVNEPILKKLYRFAYRGVTQEDLRENPSADGFMQLLRSEHFEAVRGYLESYPEILNLLDPVQLWQIPEGSKLNLLNELFLYQDKLSAELLESFNTQLLEQKKRPFLAFLDDLKKGSYANLTAYILNDIDELNVEGIMQGDLPTLVNILKTNKTLKKIEINEYYHLSFLQLLTKEKEDGYWQAPWFQKFYEKVFENIKDNKGIFAIMGYFIAAEDEKYRQLPWFQKTWKEMVMNPTEWIQMAASHRNHSFLSTILSDAQVETIDLGYAHINENGFDALIEGLSVNQYFNTLKMHFHHVERGTYFESLGKLLQVPLLREKIKTLDFDNSYFSKEHLNMLAKSLKDNSTLNKLILSNQHMLLGLIDKLLSYKDGAFRQAPWFKEIWGRIIEDPSDAIFGGRELELITLVSSIFEMSPKEIVIKSTYDFSKQLKVLEDVECGLLNISNVYFSDENMAMFSNFLRNNKTLTSVTFKGCSLSSFRMQILADGLRENTTLEKLSLSKKELFSLMSILVLDEVGPFRKAPWFKVLEAEYESYSPVEIIQDHLDKKHWGYITSYIKNPSTDVLDFTALQVEWDSGNSWRNALVMGLRDNSTLKELRLANENQWVDLMTGLMSSPPGPFTNAPWFTKARDEVFRNPGGLLQCANNRNNHDAILNLIKDAPEEIELGKYLTYAGNWFNFLAEKLRQNDDYFQLNLSGVSLGDASVAKLAEALKVNTKLKSLNLMKSFLYQGEVKVLVEGLKDNRTLEKLSLSADVMLDVIGLLIEDSEGAFREAPWFKLAWEDVIEHSDQHLKRVIEKKNYELFSELVANSKKEVLDLTAFNWCDSGWIDPALRGLKTNEVVHTLKISSSEFRDEDSMKKLIEFLQEKKTLKRLELQGALREDPRNLLIEALKTNATLEDLVFSERRAPLEVANSLYPCMDKLPENIKNWVQKVMENLRSTPVATLELCAPSYSSKAPLDTVASVVLQSLTELKMDLYAVPSTLLKVLAENKTISVLDLKLLSHFSPIADLANFLKMTDSIHTLRLQYDSFSSEDAKALSEALVENKFFKTLELRSYAFKNNSKVMPIFADAMRKTGFSKTLKVSENNELSLLNEVISDKESMQPHWTAWMDSLWGTLSANPQASLVKAIQAGHKNIARALLEMGQVSELDISDIFLDEIATENLIELLKSDKRIQSLKMKDFGHKVLVKLLPFQDQLSGGAKVWVQSTWNSLKENPDEFVGKALEKYDGNEEVAKFILNSEGIKTLNLAEMHDSKISRLSKVIESNSVLESLALSGKIYSTRQLSMLLQALQSKENLALKSIDLSNLVFEDKFEESDVRNLQAFLLIKSNLQMSVSKTAFEDEMLTDIQESSFVKSGQLIIKEE